LFVELVTDGQGYSATQVEYQVTRWLSLLSTVSTIGRSSASVRVSKDYLARATVIRGSAVDGKPDVFVGARPRRVVVDAVQ
jgi:hypothetical protein